MNTDFINPLAFFRQTILPVFIIVAIPAGSASAFVFDTDNSDLIVRWDNSLRYNAAWRMSDPKWDLVRPFPGSTISASENKFRETGGMVSNRLDVLSEFDFVYKESSGFRVSAAGWYDKRYDNHIVPGSATFFPGNEEPSDVKRYYNGPSGEFLDAFVFHQFHVGEVPIDVKLGQHTVYWGETLFSLGDGISAGQSYADVRKALSTPGIAANELFKPLNQVSFSAAINPQLALVGQYFFDWKPDLFPLAGTYFSPTDFFTYSGGTTFGGLPVYGLEENGLEKKGSWGLGAKWHPEWLNGSAGFYYRNYYPKNSFVLARNPVGLPNGYGLLVDPSLPNTKLYGFSLGKQIWGISWGMDLTYRKDANLAFKSFGRPTTVQNFVPYGNIYTATLNMIAYDGNRSIGNFSLYDSAVLTAELDYDALDKVTYDPALASGVGTSFNSRQNCAISPTSGAITAASISKGYYGCATGQSIGINIKFEPKWFQVFQGVDVTLPLFYSTGLKGNSVVPSLAQNEGQGSFSFGVTADVNNQYNFALNYIGSNYKRKILVGGNPQTNASLGDYSDRGRIAFTAKATW